jgi:hypothetical protein
VKFLSDAARRETIKQVKPVNDFLLGVNKLCLCKLIFFIGIRQSVSQKEYRIEKKIFGYRRGDDGSLTACLRTGGGGCFVHRPCDEYNA